MRRSRVLLVGLLSIGAAGPPAAAASPPAPGTTTLVSVATNGREANGWSWGAAISANGRFVAFGSTASNLLADGPKSDLFIRDLRLGVTRPLAVAGDGGPTDNASYDPTLSRSGRYVAFESVASNLVPGDTNNDWDVFVRDMRRGVVWRVNVAADGSEAEGSSGPSAISPDGHAVTFTSTASNLVAGGANHHWDVFARDLRTGVLSAVSVADDGTWGNADSISSAISRHGRRVTFSSSASNLVAGDTNGRPDVFVRDLRTHRTQLVSVAADGGLGNGWSDGGSMNADGRYVAFTSAASNLVDGDTNGTFDVFVRDLRTRRTRLVDITAEGAQFASGAAGARSSPPSRPTEGCRITTAS